MEAISDSVKKAAEQRLSPSPLSSEPHIVTIPVDEFETRLAQFHTTVEALGGTWRPLPAEVPGESRFLLQLPPNSLDYFKNTTLGVPSTPPPTPAAPPPLEYLTFIARTKPAPPPPSTEP